MDRLNGLPKYVVSWTLEAHRWTNATVLRGEVVGEVSKLKQRTRGEILVCASRPLVRTLMERDLVDELRLTVFPVALGAGERLFGDTSDKRPLRLIDTKTIGSGLAHLTYGAPGRPRRRSGWRAVLRWAGQTSGAVSRRLLWRRCSGCRAVAYRARAGRPGR